MVGDRWRERNIETVAVDTLMDKLVQAGSAVRACAFGVEDGGRVRGEG
jgi:hypothetical protein